MKDEKLPEGEGASTGAKSFHVVPERAIVLRWTRRRRRTMHVTRIRRRSKNATTPRTIAAICLPLRPLSEEVPVEVGRPDDEKVNEELIEDEALLDEEEVIEGVVDVGMKEDVLVRVEVGRELVVGVAVVGDVKVVGVVVGGVVLVGGAVLVTAGDVKPPYVQSGPSGIWMKTRSATSGY